MPTLTTRPVLTLVDKTSVMHVVQSGVSYQATIANIVGSVIPGVTYDAVVGTGLQYETLQAAIDDGKVNLLVVTSITEVADTAFSGNLSITCLPGITIDFGAFSPFLANSAAVNLYVRGNDAVWTYTYSGSKALIDFTAATAGSSYNIDGVYFSDNSTGGGTSPIQGVIGSHQVEGRLTNIRHDVADDSSSGIIVERCYINGLLINGNAGGNSSQCLVMTQFGAIENVVFTGDFATSAVVINASGDINVSNVTNKSNASIPAIKCEATMLSNIFGDGNGMTLNVKGYEGSNAPMVVSNIDSAVMTLQSGCTGLIVSDSEIISYDDTGASVGTYHFDNIEFSGTAPSLNVAGSHNIFTNCRLGSGLLIEQDYTVLVACMAGTSSGGGSDTFTVDTGVNNTIIVGCQTDVAIVDGGTGTELAANIVF